MAGDGPRSGDVGRDVLLHHGRGDVGALLKLLYLTSIKSSHQKEDGK